MKKLLTLLTFISTCSFVFGQNVEFSAAQKLFDHPTSGLFALATIPVDYNKDGIMDYIDRATNNELIVKIGTASGFEQSEDLAVAPFIYARPYDIMDFDKDGFEDIIMEGYLYIYDPIFNEYEELYFSDTTDYMHTVMGIADFDGNGYNDILTVLSSGSKQNDLSIYYYDGVDFTQERLDDEIGIGPLQLGDLENDGDMDIAIIDKYNTWVPVILVNDGQGNFTSRYIQDDKLLYNRVLNFEDMDSDGDMDLVAFDINQELYIYENTDNYLSPPVKHFIQNNAQPMSNVITDLNGDGLKEIISFNVTHEEYSIDLYIASSGFNYQARNQIAQFDGPTFFMGLNPNYDQNTLRLSNVDNDGDTDLIVSFAASNDPSVYLFENLSRNSIEETSSVLEQNVEGIDIFPNPVAEQLFVEGDLKDQPYSIFNSHGQLIKADRMSGSINITDLPNGPYLLQVKGVDGFKSARFVKVGK